MSSSYYTRLENTVVSGSALQSSLTPEDIRTLNFDEATHNEQPLAYSLSAAATANTNITIPNLIQAAVSRQLVNCGTQGGGAAQNLALLPDSISAALAYIDLFNLSSSAATGAGTVKRILTFQNSAVAAATQDVVLAVASGANGNYVQVALNGAGAGASQVLFDVSSVTTVAPGVTRTVAVYSTNTTSSAPKVIFDVLSNTA